MTTIAYRDGIIAADSGVTSGSSHVGYATKIGRGGGQYKGWVAGVSGNLDWSRAFLDSFEKGDLLPQAKGDEGGTLLISPRRQMFLWYGVYTPYRIRAPFYAIGSGCNEARGAMAAGASAIEAVRIAKRLDEGTFGPVKSLGLAPRR